MRLISIFQLVRGLPRWRDSFPQYGIKVSFWGSGTLKIVIPVENHPQKTENRLDDYHPLGGWGVLISVQIHALTIYLHIGVVNSGRHGSPHIRKLGLGLTVHLPIRFLMRAAVTPSLPPAAAVPPRHPRSPPHRRCHCCCCSHPPRRSRRPRCLCPRRARRPN